MLAKQVGLDLVAIVLQARASVICCELLLGIIMVEKQYTDIVKSAIIFEVSH